MTITASAYRQLLRHAARQLRQTAPDFVDGGCHDVAAVFVEFARRAHLPPLSRKYGWAKARHRHDRARPHDWFEHSWLFSNALYGSTQDEASYDFDPIFDSRPDPRAHSAHYHYRLTGFDDRGFAELPMSAADRHELEPYVKLLLRATTAQRRALRS
jgi:hypothetical protein